MTTSIILDREVPGRFTPGLPATRPSKRTPSQSTERKPLRRSPTAAAEAPEAHHSRTLTYPMRPTPRAEANPAPREPRPAIDVALWRVPEPARPVQPTAQSDELAGDDLLALDEALDDVTVEPPRDDVADAPREDAAPALPDLTGDLRGASAWRLLALVGAITAIGATLIVTLLP